MPSYMTIVVLALATSNVSVAFSVPVYSSREVREQSLSRREDLPESIRPPLPVHPVQPANPPTEPDKVPEAETLKKAVGSGSNVNMKQLALNFVMGITSSLFAASIFQDMNLRSVPATCSADQDAQCNSYKSTPQCGQTQDEYGQYPSQQRVVDHGKRADSGPFEAKIRSILDNNRRLELLTRAELGEALKPFTRVLDELD